MIEILQPYKRLDGTVRNDSIIGARVMELVGNKCYRTSG
jgi:hypothetical protein